MQTDHLFKELCLFSKIYMEMSCSPSTSVTVFDIPAHTDCLFMDVSDAAQLQEF